VDGQGRARAHDRDRLDEPGFVLRQDGRVRFSFGKVQAKGIAAAIGGSPADTLARFEAVSGSTGRPPGPVDTLLGETLVHAEDIRRPLGLAHQYPMEALVQAANFFKGSNLIIGTKRRIAGLSLRATDTQWSSGTGPEVTGTMLDLLMAMTGRTAAASLAGDGAETLRSRPDLPRFVPIP